MTGTGIPKTGDNTVWAFDLMVTLVICGLSAMIVRSVLDRREQRSGGYQKNVDY